MPKKKPVKDLNAFSPFDCFGGVLMIGCVPLAMFYIFAEVELIHLALCGGVVFFIALLVGLLAYFSNWAGVGRVVNIVGIILAHAYIVLGYVLWDASQKNAPFNQELPELEGDEE